MPGRPWRGALRNWAKAGVAAAALVRAVVRKRRRFMEPIYLRGLVACEHPWQTADSAHFHRLPVHRTCNSVARTLAHAWRVDGSAGRVVEVRRGHWFMSIDRGSLRDSF